jgi:deoxyribodipyrimidine photo-lyase
MHGFPDSRVRLCNGGGIDPGKDFVLYWMIANRRARWNFSLERAVAWARELMKPLVVLEALRCDYPWASDRLHRFIIDGMRDNAANFAQTDVCYYPYVEPTRGAGKGLLAALAERACLVVTDDFPCFFLPRMVSAAGRQCPVRLEAIDSNGILPLSATDRVFSTAHSFRRFLQKNLMDHVLAFPAKDPLEGMNLPRLHSVPGHILQLWPLADLGSWGNSPDLARLPIDHAVPPVATRGGMSAAEQTLTRFLQSKLSSYSQARNHPDDDATSSLSPYLHFGHISVHEVFHELIQYENWSPDRVASKATGSRAGWWGMREDAEAFIDQLITWRELGYHNASHELHFDRYESLPAWARETLEMHAADPRKPLYTLEDFDEARTHDALWNAAQTQLRGHGCMHNYLRMLWGKKILEWSASPRDALDIMVYLNNRYALDGRNPNSYSGIFWVLGKYDRPWGPERAVFGKVRYMSSPNTARKVRLKTYLSTYACCQKFGRNRSHD